MTESVDVLGYLQGKGLVLKRASGDEVHTACWWCAEDPGKRGRLYINTNPAADIPGLFMCHICGVHGALPTIKRHFGDYTVQQEKEDDSHVRRLILAEASAYYHEALSENVDAVHWLRDERGIRTDTIIEHQLGWADGGLYRHLRERGFKTRDMEATGLVYDDRKQGRVADFLEGRVTIPYFVAGNVVMIRGRALDGDGRKYVTPPGQKARLFNSDATWGAEEILIAEGEFDCLVVKQLGYAAVAVPGAVSWQPAWDGYFTQARRVYVAFDGDKAGQLGAAKVEERLGAKARVVEVPGDVSDWVIGGGRGREEFDKLLRTSAGGLLVSVDEAMSEHAGLQGQVGLKFGFTKFDLMLEPGLLESQVMVFLAKSGAGKTLTLLNVFQRVCDWQPEARILFISLEQTRGDWWERARRIYRFFNVGATDADAAAFWRPRLMIVDRNRLTEAQLRSAIEDFRYEMGRESLVAVDYLGYWAQSFKGERYERTSDAVMALKGIAKDMRTRVIAPHQVSRMTMYGSEPGADSGRDSGVVEETADFVIPLWSLDTQQGRKLEERTGELHFKISKSRHGGVGLVTNAYLAPLNLAIVPEEDALRSQWARNELHYQAKHRETWEHALIRHEADAHPDADYSQALAAWHRHRQTAMEA